MLKRGRLPDSKGTLPKTKKKRFSVIDPTFENAIGQSTVIDIFLEFADVESTANLSTTNKLFQALCHKDNANELYWEKKFTQDFRPPYVKKNFKLQYIAEYLLQLALKTDQPQCYAKLKKHILPHKQAEWCHYYVAALIQHELKEKKKQPLLQVDNHLSFHFTAQLPNSAYRRILDNIESLMVEHALAALLQGIFHAGNLILDYFHMLDNTYRCLLRTYSLRDLNFALDQLPASAAQLKLCFETKLMRGSAVRQLDIQNEAFQCLMLLAADENITPAEFLSFTIGVLRRTRFISIQDETILRSCPQLMSSPTIFDLLKALLNHPLTPRLFVFHLQNWIKQWETCGSPVAHYYAAEEKRQDIMRKLLQHGSYQQSVECQADFQYALNQYKDALAGREYRAAATGLDQQLGGLHA